MWWFDPLWWHVPGASGRHYPPVVHRPRRRWARLVNRLRRQRRP